MIARAVLFALCCLMPVWVSGATSTNVTLSPDGDIHVRPGTTRTVTYTLTPQMPGHSINVTGTLPTLEFAWEVTGNDNGSIHFTALATADNEVLREAQLVITNSQGTNVANKNIRYLVDRPPRLTSPTVVALNEDRSSQIVCEFADISPLSFSIPSPLQSAHFHQIALVTTSIDSVTLRVQGAQDLHGSTGYDQQPIRLPIEVRDAMGWTRIEIPVSIAPTNDPPLLAATASPGLRMDPAAGTPVAPFASLGITPGVDGDIHLAHSGVRLGWEAEVVSGQHGADLLSLAGDADYRLAGTNIIHPAAGSTVVATWERPSEHSHRLRVTLAAGAGILLAQASHVDHLDRLARRLRYAHLLSPATDVTRSVRLHLREPDWLGGHDQSQAVTATCTVAAVNRPPVVALAPLELEPSRSKPLAVQIQDGDDLALVTVRVVAPLPLGGRVEPLVCTAAEAIANGLVYHHEAGDLSDDRVTLAVSDGVNPPVLVSAAIAVRVKPDRLSIVSDPLLAVVADHTTAVVVSTVPAASLSLLPYGSPFGPLPPGVSAVGSELRFNWAIIPATTTWIPLTLRATTTDPSLDVDRRSADQRMLIRVHRQAAGFAN